MKKLCFVIAAALLAIPAAQAQEKLVVIIAPDFAVRDLPKGRTEVMTDVAVETASGFMANVPAGRYAECLIQLPERDTLYDAYGNRTTSTYAGVTATRKAVVVGQRGSLHSSGSDFRLRGQRDWVVGDVAVDTRGAKGTIRLSYRVLNGTYLPPSQVVPVKFSLSGKRHPNVRVGVGGSWGFGDGVQVERRGQNDEDSVDDAYENSVGDLGYSMGAAIAQSFFGSNEGKAGGGGRPVNAAPSNPGTLGSQGGATGNAYYRAYSPITGSLVVGRDGKVTSVLMNSTSTVFADLRSKFNGRQRIGSRSWPFHLRLSREGRPYTVDCVLELSGNGVKAIPFVTKENLDTEILSPRDVIAQAELEGSILTFIGR